ncbi:MAG: Histidine-tRNA ligase [candidate division WWE3 bacterium GW2011_GWF1_42_14]|uniref:Histidine--tRNA ligase n=2 Tax=Katanobacteria TaxID=422282 RepID=A0A0G0YRG7_UNCKA|nr:MAG: Histidine-tRNA ligase [candidate division WWE3 bacterium GW2011_GWA1_42_12]KKS33652.1 MAG: Histidine-tRNA ligase [candidate division WWE3 bacterium GW2011_GWD1_42_14]KKS39220.1 MAG: Histidine-tRNA ligase [candidate division WWE3 bacterium GW2011_GWF1_42_14]KKS40718.1 MAG: Histidine-tRNA ligase [candidate division WWE3 bacterium GW2011_GWE1_42_16]KKS66873.1 MAG: Histidine-tRNA ligase [candidate division WWE3 bacterium GW2011_GWB1_42_6]
MELLPNDQLAFNKMLNSIRESFELCGFVPLDTPVIEKAEILMAKGGEETERQTYSFKKGDNDLALRFDLTVPFARYVSQRMNELSFPFKRYQIGKVFRGERPQKGRFREFYQCDIDIVDRDNLSLAYDAEILSVTYTTFERLSIGGFLIKINNRKLLAGFIEEFGLSKKLSKILREIDKKDKTGEDSVKKELDSIGCTFEQIDKLMDYLNLNGTSDKILKALKSYDIKNETFQTGLNEMEELTKYLGYMNIPASCWKIDLSIARGLDYYTGTVFETVLKEYPEFGSVCGGGRYDNLAEYFTDQKLPGVGVSIGLTRLFDQLNENGLIKNDEAATSRVAVVTLGDYSEIAYGLVRNLRNNNIASEVLIAGTGLKKKLSMISKKGIRFAAILGENEIKNKVITVKDMDSGKQEEIYFENIVNFIKGA